jgi:hypothetical protein
MSIPSKPDKVSTAKKVYWDYDTPQSTKCRETFAKEFDETDSRGAKKNEAAPKLTMMAKTRIESTTTNEQARRGEKVCQLKFENLSMELKEELKEETEEDMFADDVDLEDTFEVKKEETDSKIENIQILRNALNSDMFEDDDKAAEMFSIKN